MKTNGNTILLVAGQSGIWPLLAEGFVLAGNEVVVCGRSQEALDRTLRRLPSLNTITCDVSLQDDRALLADRLREFFPRLNVLLVCSDDGDAIDLLHPDASSRLAKELSAVEASILLAVELLPRLMKQSHAGVIFVSEPSGLAAATLSSFARSLRRRYRNLSALDVTYAPLGTRYGGEIAVAAQLLRGIRRAEHSIRLGPPRKLEAVTRLLRLNTLLSP